jgi:hypothetical protein
MCNLEDKALEEMARDKKLCEATRTNLVNVINSKYDPIWELKQPLPTQCVYCTSRVSIGPDSYCSIRKELKQ